MRLGVAARTRNMTLRTFALLRNIGVSVATGAALLSAPALASKQHWSTVTSTTDLTQVATTLSPDTLHARCDLFT